MSWKVKNIDTKINKVKLVNDQEVTLELTIPKELVTHEAKQAWIKGQCDAQDGIKGTILRHAKKTKNLMIVIAVESLLIIGMIVLILRR